MLLPVTALRLPGFGRRHSCPGAVAARMLVPPSKSACYRAFADNAGRTTVLGHIQADSKLQNEAEGVAVHDAGGDDEADSVVGADNVEWIEVQLVLGASLMPPCFSLLCAANLCLHDLGVARANCHVHESHRQ